MKNLSKLVLILSVILMFVQTKIQAQTRPIATTSQIDVTGKWQSSSKSIFYVLETEEGFKYQNTTKGKTQNPWFFAKWQNKKDLNKYIVYKRSDSKPIEMYFTVKKDNNGVVNMLLYDAADGSSKTWTKIGD